MYRIQEVVKCYLFLIFTRFFYEHIHVGSNQSLTRLLCFSFIYKDLSLLLEPIPKVNKIWSMIGKILLHIGKNPSEARR